MSRWRQARNWARGLWPDHNLLRRASDRAEAAILAGLLVAFLAGAPLAAVLAGRWAAGVGERTEQAQRAGRYQVAAVLLADAPYTSYAWSQSQVRARWTAPSGQRHTGLVSAPIGTRQGTKVTIWTDRSGRITGSPLRHDQVASQAVLAAVVAPVMLAFALLCLGMLAHQLLDRRRLAAWAADWRVTGPQWTRQR